MVWQAMLYLAFKWRNSDLIFKQVREDSYVLDLYCWNDTVLEPKIWIE